MIFTPLSKNAAERKKQLSVVFDFYDKKFFSKEIIRKDGNAALMWARFFSTKEKRKILYAFFEISPDLDFFNSSDSGWEKIRKGINNLLYRIIDNEENAIHFLYDKQLGKASEYVMTKTSMTKSEKEQFYSYSECIIIQPESKQKKDREDPQTTEENGAFSLYFCPRIPTSPQYQNPSMESIVEEGRTFKKIKSIKNFETIQNLFLKDLLSVLIKTIIKSKETGETFKTVNVKTFLDIEFQKKYKRTEDFINTFRQIIKKRSYEKMVKEKKVMVSKGLKKTILSVYKKEEEIKRLNRDSFKTIMCCYIADIAIEKSDNKTLLEYDFVKYLKDHKIYNTLFYPSVFMDNMKINRNFLSGIIIQELTKSTIISGSVLSQNILPKMETYQKMTQEEKDSLENEIEAKIIKIRNSLGLDISEEGTRKTLKVARLKDSPGLIKKLSALKKISYRTRAMIREEIDTIWLIENKRISNIKSIYSGLPFKAEKNGQNLFLNQIINLISMMTETGISEKNIRPILKRFIAFKTYHDHFKMNEESIYITKSQMFIHDWVNVIDTLSAFFDEVQKIEGITPKLLNDIARILCRYTPGKKTAEEIRIEISRLQAYLSDIHEYIPEDKKMNSFKDFHPIYAKMNKEKEKRQKNVILENLNIDINEKKFIKISTTMRSRESALDRLAKIAKNKEKRDLFLSTEKDNKVEIEKKEYTVKIVSHKETEGLFGATVRGVCIPSFGDHRGDQLNNSFMNLIIEIKGKIILWGLLCRAVSRSKKTYYILNNFQGGIADKKKTPPVEIKKVVHKVFDLFMLENNIQAILFKDFSFNSLQLKSEKSKEINKDKMETLEITLERKTRLDFMFNEKGVVQTGFTYVEREEKSVDNEVAYCMKKISS